ncbi:conserved hypothetical protein [Rhodococcus sp. RD6.2]|uniref:hypothetical protein n=1 Tax=Rhodococcus sp. RD6.2 TaxID=260936 RepID=UPI00063BC82D|nr:hypothetical protein [Rhodococcus sp. RD6.2]CRK51842.1 conserved hypothetical protein [Rhodococcus sp. RD6.2]
MIVDCSGCAVRGVACGDCVVTVLLGYPEFDESTQTPRSGAVARMSLEQDERVALAVLADAELVPPLRLVEAAGETQTAWSLSVRDAGVA